MPHITSGLVTAAHALLGSGLVVQCSLAVVICLIIILTASSAVQHDGFEEPKALPGPSFFSIVPFFRHRYDFLNWGFHVTGQNIFRFQLMNHPVIALSGTSARRAFFYAKGFDLTEGFKILSGAIPMVPGVTSGLQMQRITTIHRRLAAVQRNDRLSQLIPAILKDSEVILRDLGTAGTFDPFDKIYELTFQTTVRCLSSSDIADDAKLVARLRLLYDRLETGTTPATVLLPWLPTPAMLKKLWATKEIYDIVVRAIDVREKSGIARDDTLQMLLDSGDDKLVVVGFIMGLLIAGARATGTTACWVITYLGAHPEWAKSARAEAEALMETHADLTLPDLSARLASIPLEAWESSTPVLDSITRETLRVAQPHVAMRRNLGPETYIDGKRIPAGAYLVYPFSDIHLDPEVYPDPWRFDPARQQISKDRGDLAYVGWGVGKTTCLGTRLAKLELKLITSLFLLTFDHTIVDGAGAVRETSPRPDWNDTLFCRPTGESCHVSYQRRQDTC